MSNKTTFRVLAEIISDRNYFDINEIEKTIEAFFKLYMSEVRDSEMLSDDIIRQRNAVIAELEQEKVKRYVIEKKLFVAKEDIRNGKTVDKYWMSRANLAFRITKTNIFVLQNKLTNIKTLEKRRNVERSENEDRIIRKNIFKVVKEKFGPEVADQIIESALNVNS